MPIFSIASAAASGAVGSATQFRSATWSVGAVLPQNSTNNLQHSVISMTYEPTSKYLFVCRTGATTIDTNVTANTRYSWFNLGHATEPNKAQHAAGGILNNVTGSVSKWIVTPPLNDTLVTWMRGTFTDLPQSNSVKGLAMVNITVSTGVVSSSVPYTSSNFSNTTPGLKAWFAWRGSNQLTRAYAGGSFTFLFNNQVKSVGSIANVLQPSIQQPSVSRLNTLFPTGANVTQIFQAGPVDTSSNCPVYLCGTSISTTSPQCKIVKFIWEFTITGSVETLGTSPNTGPSNGEIAAVATNATFSIVYVCGTFTQINGTTDSNGTSANGIAMYSVQTGWTPLNILPLGTNPDFRDIVVAPSGNVYVACGNVVWTGVGTSTTFNRIAMYNPNTGAWSALDGGVNNTCTSLAILDSETMYVGGSFTAVGGGTTTAYGLVRWSGGPL